MMAGGCNQVLNVMICKGRPLLAAAAGSRWRQLAWNVSETQRENSKGVLDFVLVGMSPENDIKCEHFEEVELGCTLPHTRSVPWSS